MLVLEVCERFIYFRIRSGIEWNNSLVPESNYEFLKNFEYGFSQENGTNCLRKNHDWNLEWGINLSYLGL